jgi:6-phosphogluconolactonase
VAEPEIRTHESPEALAAAVADRLLTRLAAVQAEGRVPSIALTGGTIAGKLHEAVVTAVGEGAGNGTDSPVDWSRVDVWFGDERFVPAGDPERNDGQAAAALLDHLPFDPARIHPMPASDGAHRDLADAATAYGDELRSQGDQMFDVVMLGVGPDAHVASLFPGFPQLDVDDTIAVPVTGSPKPPPERISLTFPALSRTREVWFLVSGAGKAEAVATSLATGDRAADVHRAPAVGVHGQERTVWFLDEEAAARL